MFGDQLSVVGLNFDYEILNMTKQWSYMIYNASLFFSPVIQKQYFEKYGYGQVLSLAMFNFDVLLLHLIMHFLYLKKLV